MRTNNRIVRGLRRVFRAGLDLIFPNKPLSLRSCKVHDLSMLLSLEQHSQRKMAMGIFEKNETRMMKDILKPGDVFLDIGSNVGYYSVLAASKGALAYAFDPVEINYNLLKMTALINPQVSITPMHAAVSDRVGYVEFDVDPKHTASSRIHTGNLDRSFVKVNVPTVTIDSQGFEKVDVIKVDVEGAEMLVLRGLRETLLSCRPRLLMIELTDDHLVQFGSTVSEVVQLMKNMGYSVVNYKDGKFIPISTPRPYANNNFFFSAVEQ